MPKKIEDPTVILAIEPQDFFWLIAKILQKLRGADVVMCFDCSNTREKYEQGLAIARGQWKAVEA